MTLERADWHWDSAEKQYREKNNCSVDSSPLKAVRLPTTAPPGRAVLRKTALAVSSGNAGMDQRVTG